jgi:basic membrane protein A
MKKLVSALLAGVMSVSLAACSSSSTASSKASSTAEGGSDASSDIKVAMITDSGDITDESFNQTTYEASKEWSEENGADFKYYKPTKDNDDARTQSIETAIAEGYNVIVMPGYLFAKSIVECSKEYPDVKFVAIDVAANDLLGAALGDKYDYNPDNWDVSEYYNTDNTYCAVYHEEIPGYMAGYAAVKLGYKKLGFLGGMSVPAVMRYGYGYVQGADAAAKELGLTDVEINYVYGGKFANDPQINAAMQTWFSNGTEVVFGCGGRVYISAAEEAQKLNKKMIGVDVDQKASIDGTYGEGMTVTSAMKGLAPTVKDTLTAIKDGKWSEKAGVIDNLGMVSGDDPSKNYVQLGTTQYEDGKFTEDDYKALVKKIYDGDIKVSNDISADEPTAENVKINFQGTILS